jgi:hypothetical protein
MMTVGGFSGVGGHFSYKGWRGSGSGRIYNPIKKVE